MLRPHLLVASCFLAALACSDHSGLINPNDPTITPPVDAFAEITGTIVVDESAVTSESVHLLKADGASILLVGNATSELVNLAGGEVVVRGTWDANPGLVVESFQVLAMNGRAAFDGVLCATADGLALLLSDGTYHALNDPPAGLAEFMNARLWVTGSADDPPILFGVIEAR